LCIAVLGQGFTEGQWWWLPTPVALPRVFIILDEKTFSLHRLAVCSGACIFYSAASVFTQAARKKLP
jgi:hypothetical protein